MKTITVYDGEFPTCSFLKGKHSTEVFNQAFLKESEFHRASAWADSELKTEFWRQDSNQQWEKCEESDPGAMLVTIGYWD